MESNAAFQRQICLKFINVDNSTTRSDQFLELYNHASHRDLFALMLVKLIKAVWVHWKERHERAQGKESSLDVLQPARTRLIPGAFVSGVSHSSHEPGLGACSTPAGRRAGAKGAEQPRNGLTHRSCG